MSPKPPKIARGRKEKAASLLLDALDIVSHARRATYGTPKDNHARTAALWSAYLGCPITPRQVCLLNALQKISRDAHAPKRDNLVDLAGYAANADLLTHDDNCNCEHCR